MLKPPISQEGWAEVRARDRVVRYRLTGTGPIVLLLAHEDTRLRELALRDGDQIGRVVLIPDGEECDAASEGAIATTSRRISMPLLIVRGVASGAVHPLVSQFLGESRSSHVG
jgi:hypothetical protein